MMTRALEWHRECGQAFAMLWASFGAVYQRYGYGLASAHTSYVFNPTMAALRDPVAGTHRTALVVGDKPGHRALAELWAVTRDGGKAGGAGVFSNEVSATEWLLSGHYAEHPHKFVNENIIPL